MKAETSQVTHDMERMREAHLHLFGVTCFCAFLFVAAGAARAQQSETVIEVIDQSPAESPLRLSGSLRCVESIEGPERVRTILTGKLASTNVTEKPILAYLVRVDVTTPIGRYRTMRQQIDGTFVQQLLDPHQTWYDEVSSDSTETDEIISAQSVEAAEITPAQPVARAKVLWVQFVGGSEYGDRREARALLDARNALREKLGALIRAYERSGESAFAEELMVDERTRGTRPFVRRLRRIYSERGIEAALRLIRRALHNARANWGPSFMLVALTRSPEKRSVTVGSRSVDGPPGR